MFIAERNAPLPPWRENRTETLDSATPDIRNVDATIGLFEYRALELMNGRSYRVPPVSGFDGVRLLDILQRLEKAGDSPEDFYEIYADLNSLAKKLLIPMGWRKYFWKLHIRPSPLKGATVRELGWVAGFLFRCATSGPIRMSESRTLSTSSKTSARTQRVFQRSSPRKAFR